MLVGLNTNFSLAYSLEEALEFRGIQQTIEHVHSLAVREESETWMVSLKSRQSARVDKPACGGLLAWECNCQRAQSVAVAPPSGG